MSRATEGFSASTATLPDSSDAIVLLQSGTRLRLVSGTAEGPPLDFGHFQGVAGPHLVAQAVPPANGGLKACPTNADGTAP